MGPPLASMDAVLRSDPRPDRALLLGLLALTFALRAWRADQPILENYVGRQVPTAMVARNVQRGSGFLSPQLDTGPFPNLFLVEPPIAAQIAVRVSVAFGRPLDESGRLVSAAATALAAWGLYGLMRRRRGPAAAVAATIAFATFPVTLRYGRAFQPDAVALGFVVAGLNCWDVPGRGHVLAGWLLLAGGLAQKVTWNLAFLPPLWVILAAQPRRLRLVALACVLPALAWYVHAALALSAGGTGSAASMDNASNWLSRLASPDALRFRQVARDLVVRSFTPLGFGLAVAGLFAGVWRGGVAWSHLRGHVFDPCRGHCHEDVTMPPDRLWIVWMLGAALTLLLLFGKLHHDYYWIVLAPAAAGCVGVSLDSLASRSRALATLAIAALIALGLVQSRSTWTTPEEWRDAPPLAEAVARHVPTEALVIAPEAVIHLGDRRGCRLEWESASVRRAANEWRPSPPFDAGDPADLVAFYRRRAGARYFADLDAGPAGSARRRLIESLRRDPGVRILEDRPGRYLLVEFADTD